MGMQFSFYMMPSDEEEFLRHVTETFSVSVLPYWAATDQLIALQIPAETAGHEDRTLWLWHRGLPGTVQLLHIRFADGAQHPLGAEAFVVDVDNSDATVVEFQRCALRSDGLLPGRLWCQPRNFSAELQGRKWFDHLRGWLRRRSAGERHWGSCLVLPEAARWACAGGNLLGGTQPFRPKSQR